MKKLIGLAPFLMLIAGCGDSGGDYVGLWEEKGNEYHRLIKISQESDNLVLTEGLHVTAEGLNTASEKPFVITQQGKQLIGPLGMALALSDDEKTLMFAGDSYNRIDDDRIKLIQQEQIKATQNRERELAKLKAEQERIRQEAEQKSALIAQGKPACDALMAEYRTKRKEIDQTHRKRDQRDTRKQLMDGLKTEYTEKQKAIFGCNRYI